MGKKSTQTTTQTQYGKTTTSNPYAIATTTNDGTEAYFQPGTALDSVYNYVNNNINSLLDEYLNPSLNSTTNQAKLNSYISNLNRQSYNNLENNIINPLSKRNMIRSSQATDLYKNLSNKNADSLSSYINELLAESQNNTASIINDLLKAYMQGYTVLSNMQGQSLATSQGNSTRTSTSSQDGGNAQMQQAIQSAMLLSKYL